MTSCHVRDFQLKAQIVAAIPLTPVGTPWAITRQYMNSDLIQFYSRMPHNSVNYPEKLRAKKQQAMDDKRDACTNDDDRKQFAIEIFEPPEFRQGHLTTIDPEVRKFVDRIRGDIDDTAWKTFDEWPYFQHYRIEEINDGYYDRLEAQQGKNHTYYVGGLMNFELVNNIMLYSKHIVALVHESLRKEVR